MLAKTAGVITNDGFLECIIYCTMHCAQCTLEKQCTANHVVMWAKVAQTLIHFVQLDFFPWVRNRQNAEGLGWIEDPQQNNVRGQIWHPTMQFVSQSNVAYRCYVAAILRTRVCVWWWRHGMERETTGYPWISHTKGQQYGALLFLCW